MFVLQAGEVFLRRCTVSKEQHGGFRKGPFEMGIADFGAGGAVTFPSGLLASFDQATIRDKILDPGEALNVMDFVEQHETENLADTGHGL